MDTTQLNPYKNSNLKKLAIQNFQKGQRLKIAFLDIDSTLAGNGSGTGNPADIQKVQDLLKAKNYIYIPITSRTEEMLMTEDQYYISKERYDFSRPQPKLKTVNGLKTYVNPPEVEPPAILNPVMMSTSTGTKIYVQQEGGGYAEDLEYRNQFGMDSKEWRSKVFKMTDELKNKGCEFSLQPIEYSENFEKNITDVYPLDYRFQINFTSLEQKKHFTSLFLKPNYDVTLGFRVSDESNPNKEKYSIYITPKDGHKTAALEWILNKISIELAIDQKDILLLIAGDSWLDVEMGVFGGKKTDPQSQFLIAGGSRLTPYFTNAQMNEFAGEDLSSIKKYITPLPQKGMYLYQKDEYKRTIIIADEKYPGKIWAESMIKFLYE